MWEAIGQFAVALGGASVIIVGVSAFIGKWWAEFLMKSKLAKYEKDLTIELEKAKSYNDRLSHILNDLYDEEIRALKELSKLQIGFVDDIVFLFRKPSDKQKELAENAYTAYSTVLLENELFIDRSLFDSLNGFRTKGHALLILYDFYAQGQSGNDKAKKQADELIAESNLIRKLMREYVANKKKFLGEQFVVR